MFKKKTITLASAMLLLITTSPSNAALITQELLFLEDGTTQTTVAGSITINTGTLDSFGEAVEWVEFNLFGSDIITQMEADASNPGLFGNFLAVANAFDPRAGLEFLSFDVSDSTDMTYNGLSDPLNGDHLLDIFFASNTALNTFGELSFGDVSVVPEPSALALMALALGLVSMRLKRNS